MGNIPDLNKKEPGIFGRAWIDTKNMLTRKSRAGRSIGRTPYFIIIGMVLFSSYAAFVNYGGFNSSFWEAFLASAGMGLFLLLWGVITIFLGMLAKYLRRSLWPNSFRAASQAEDYFESAAEDEESDENPPRKDEGWKPMTDEDWKMIKRL